MAAYATKKPQLGDNGTRNPVRAPGVAMVGMGGRVDPLLALANVRASIQKIAKRGQADASLNARRLPVMDEFLSIKTQLQDVGLFHDGTLVQLVSAGNRVVLDAEGQLVSAGLLEGVDAPYTVLTWGGYSRSFAQIHRPLRASNDDMAQMFGPTVLCGTVPPRWANAFLIENWGFLVTGRYVGELVAAAILLERMCQTELLAPSIGKLQYLNPALCVAEHAVYLAKYSQGERKAKTTDAGAFAQTASVAPEHDPGASDVGMPAPTASVAPDSDADTSAMDTSASTASVTKEPDAGTSAPHGSEVRDERS